MMSQSNSRKSSSNVATFDIPFALHTAKLVQSVKLKLGFFCPLNISHAKLNKLSSILNRMVAFSSASPIYDLS